MISKTLQQRNTIRKSAAFYVNFAIEEIKSNELLKHTGIIFNLEEKINLILSLREFFTSHKSQPVFSEI